MQVAMMIATASSATMLHPSESLRRRQRHFTRLRCSTSGTFDRLWQAAALRSWINHPESAVLILTGLGRDCTQAQLAATMMTDLLRSRNKTTLWALRPPDRQMSDSSVIEVLRYLAMQAMQLDSSKTGNKVSLQFNAAMVASAKTERDWVEVLEVLLRGHPGVYLIIDAEMLGQYARDQREIESLVQLFKSGLLGKTGTVVKVVVLSHVRIHAASGDCVPRTFAVSVGKAQNTYAASWGRHKTESRQRNALKFKRRAAGSCKGGKFDEAQW